LGKQVDLPNFGLLYRALAIGFIFSQLNHALLQLVVHVDSHLANHYDDELISEVALFDDDFALIVDSLVELVADVEEGLPRVVLEKGHVLLQVHR